MGKHALPGGPPASLVKDKPWQGPCPFKEGDLVESRAFTEGYRDAWFVCRVLAVKEAPGSAAYDLTLKCVDFDEDDPFQCQLYERNPLVSEAKWELMLRPLPPEASLLPSAKPDGQGASENCVTYIIKRGYAIGDAVEYLCNFGRWAGRISELSDEHAAVWWRPPPHGEGGEEINIPLEKLRPAMVRDRGQWSFPGHPYGPLGTVTDSPVEYEPGAQKPPAAKPKKVGRPALNREAVEGPPGTAKDMRWRRKPGHRERENAKLPPFSKGSVNTRLSPAERIQVARKALEKSETDADLDDLEDAIRTILGCRPKAYPKKGYIFKVARHREILAKYADLGKPSGFVGNVKRNDDNNGAGEGDGKASGSGAGKENGNGNGDRSKRGAAKADGDEDRNVNGDGFRNGNESGAANGNRKANGSGSGNGSGNGNGVREGIGEVQSVQGAPKRKVTPKRPPAVKRKTAPGTGVKRGLESAFEEEESSPEESDEDFFFGPVDLGEAASGGTLATDEWGMSPGGIPGSANRSRRRGDGSGKSSGQGSGVDSSTAKAGRNVLVAESRGMSKGAAGSAKGTQQPKGAGGKQREKVVLPPFSKDSLNTQLSGKKRSEIARRTLAECTDRADLGKLEKAIRTVLACRPPKNSKKGVGFKVAHLRAILARCAKTGRASGYGAKAAGGSKVPGGMSPGGAKAAGRSKGKSPGGTKTAGGSEAPDGRSPGGTKAAGGSEAPGGMFPGGTWRVWTKRASEGRVESCTLDTSVRPRWAPRSGGALPADVVKRGRMGTEKPTPGGVNKLPGGNNTPGEAV